MAKQKIKTTKTKTKYRKSDNKNRCSKCGRFMQSSMFEFTEEEFKEITKKAMLNEELTKIFEMKIKGYSIIQISMELNMSERTVNRRIKELKNKIMRVLQALLFLTFF